MQYNPKAVSEDDRSFAYKIMWLGLPLSILFLLGTVFEPFAFFATVSGGFLAGMFIALVFTPRQDEFYREQIAWAANWALSFAGLAMFALIAPPMREYPMDTLVVLAVMATIFHAALTFRRLRDR